MRPAALNLAELQRQVQKAEDLLGLGRHLEAYQAYVTIVRQRLDEMAGAENFVAADMVVLERLADLAALFGDRLAADEILKAKMTLYRRAGNALALQFTLLKRLHLALGCGQIDEAGEAVLDIEQMWTGPLAALDITEHGLADFEASLDWSGCQSDDRAILLARLWLVLGWWLLANGQYRDAGTLLERGLAYARAPSAGTGDAVLPLRLLKIRAALESGDIEACTADLDRLDSHAWSAREASARVEWLALRGKLALMRGDYPAATAGLETIVEFCASGGFDQALAAARLNLAQALTLLNHTRAARRLIALARRWAEESGDRVLLARAALLDDLALTRTLSGAEEVPVVPSVTHMLRGSRPSQRERFERPLSLDANSQAASFLELFDDRALAVQHLLALGAVPAADAEVERLAQIFGATDSELIAARLRVLSGIVDYYAGRLESAEHALSDGSVFLERKGFSPELWQVQRMLGWCASRRGQPDRAAPFAARAVKLLEHLADKLPAADRALFLLNKWTTEEEHLAGELDALVARRKAWSTAAALMRPLRAWALRRAGLALLARVEAYREKLAFGTNLRLAWGESRRIRAGSLVRPEPGRAIIVFLVLPDRVASFVLTRHSFNFGIMPLTRLALREQVSGWYGGLREGGPSRDLGAAVPPTLWGSADEEPAAQEPDDRTGSAFDLLQLTSCLDALPAGVSALTVVPDDVLGGLPFAALSHRGRPLVENYAVSISFSCLKEIRRRPPNVPAEALLVSVASGFDGLPDLPGAAAEARALVPWFEGHAARVTMLENEAATTPQVRERLTHATYVHVISHGIFVPEAPDRSGIVLLPGEGESDMLSLSDLAAMDLSQVVHMTLSSCWSADSFALPGRKIIGLADTLWRAGAGSILACLWPVDDEVAVVFMERFYGYLDTDSRGEALRRTQRDFQAGSAGTGFDTSDPFFWAGFTLYGHTTPLARVPGTQQGRP